MKTKQFCPECDQFLDTLTEATRQLFGVCSEITAVLEKERRTKSPILTPLLARTRILTSECSAIRQAFEDHRSSGHAVSSSFVCARTGPT